MLLVMTVVAAFGMYVNSAVIVRGFFLTILSVVLSVYLMFQVSNRNKDEKHRMGCLAALAFQMGFISGPLIH